MKYGLSVCDNDGPLSSGIGRSCLARTRRTKFLSISTLNAWLICCVIRSQPKHGLCCFTSTIVWMGLGGGRLLLAFLFCPMSTAVGTYAIEAGCEIQILPPGVW